MKNGNTVLLTAAKRELAAERLCVVEVQRTRQSVSRPSDIHLQAGQVRRMVDLN